jgi:CubicO group peptidase (beta-lactamase class C family)
MVLLIFAVLAAIVPRALSQVNLPAPCPLLGQIFPPPIDLSSQSTWQNATTTLARVLSNATLVKSNETSFAIQIITKNSIIPVYEYYHKAPSHLYGSGNSTTIGKDAIFRIASVSKMFTVYALLLECGFKCFEDPITKYVPELKNAKFNNEIDTEQWEQVTLGALASQMSGIGRDCELPSLPALA